VNAIKDEFDIQRRIDYEILSLSLLHMFIIRSPSLIPQSQHCCDSNVEGKSIQKVQSLGQFTICEA